MDYVPPRDGYNRGYVVYLLIEHRQRTLPEAIRTYVRVPDELDLSDAAALADAIVAEVSELERSFLDDLLGDNPRNRKPWERRLAQCGGIDEMSTGVQATYFSPTGLLVGVLAYIDAEWMDD